MFLRAAGPPFNHTLPGELFLPSFRCLLVVKCRLAVVLGDSLLRGQLELATSLRELTRMVLMHTFLVVYPAQLCGLTSSRGDRAANVSQDLPLDIGIQVVHCRRLCKLTRIV